MKEKKPRDPKKTPSLPPVLALARQQYNLCCYFVTSKPIINQYIRLISALDLRSLLFKKKRENKSVQRQLNQIRLVIFLICFLNDVINYEYQLMTKTTYFSIHNYLCGLSLLKMNGVYRR